MLMLNRFQHLNQVSFITCRRDDKNRSTLTSDARSERDLGQDKCDWYMLDGHSLYVAGLECAKNVRHGY